MFDKGAVKKWSSKIYTLKEIHINSYLLDNGKIYKYYQLQKVNISDEEKKKREEQMKEIKKQNLIKRRLNRDGIELNRIVKTKRKRF